MKRYLILLVLFAVILAGCGPQSEELVPTALPVSTDAPTAQPTSLPAATNTLMPLSSTRTPEPMLTATVRPPNEPELLAALDCLGNFPVAFSSDSKIIALGGHTVQLRSIPAFELTHEFEFQDSQKNNYKVINFAFSSDASLLATVISEYPHGFVPESQLLVWNIATEQLLIDVDLEKASMTYLEHRPYEFTAQAMAFIPDSSRLVYANGNRVEIRDVLDVEGDLEVFDLGKDMFASDITIRGDGNYASILMAWHRNHTFPVLARMLYRAQVWHINSQSLRRDLRFDEVIQYDESMFLVGPILMHSNEIEGTLEGQDLYENSEYQFPFRRGEIILSPDATRLVAFRYYREIPENERGIEIWDNYNGRKLFDFDPDFISENDYFHFEAKLSPNNKYLIVVYDDGTCYLWDLMPDIEAGLYQSD